MKMPPRDPSDHNVVRPTCKRPSGDAMIETLESRSLLSSSLMTVAVPANTAVAFSTTTGAADVLVFRRCGGSVVFAGSDLAQSAPIPGKAVLSGTVSVVEQINVLESSGAASAVVLQAKHSAQPVEIDGFSAAAEVRQLQLSDALFSGNLTTQGTTSAGFGPVSDSVLQFGASLRDGAAGRLTLTSGDITDSQITSDLPIAALRTGNFVSTDPGTAETQGSSAVAAPSVAAWHAAGDVSCDLQLDGGAPWLLGVFSVTGDLAAGYWSIAGGAGRITARSVASQFAAKADGILESLRTTEDEDGSFSVAAANSIVVGGNMNGGLLQFGNSFSPSGSELGALDVSGVMTGVRVSSAGNINSVAAMSMSGDFISAGLDPALPTTSLPAPAGLLAHTRIGSISVSRHGSFTGTDVIAGDLRSVDLGTLNVDNNGIAFGLSAITIEEIQISSLSAEPSSSLKLQHLPALSLSGQLQKQGLTAANLRDFSVNIDA